MNRSKSSSKSTPKGKSPSLKASKDLHNHDNKSPGSRRQESIQKQSTRLSNSQVIQRHAIHDSFQSLLHDHLIAIMRMSLTLNSQKLLHDPEYLQEHIEQRAVAGVEEELSLLLDKLNHLHVSDANNSVSAYAQLSRSLLSDLEHAILGNDFRQQISNLRDNNQSLKTEAVRIQTNMNEFLARKDQVILSLESEKEVLEFKNKSLLKAVDMLNVELEKSTRRVAEMNEKNIEICMQGIAYKNEVDVGCDKILNSIQARVGFVPSTVHKQVCNLKILKPPGDPKFHMARAKIHRGGKLRSGKKVDAKKGEEKSQIESLENSFASLNTITTIKTIESIPSSIPPEM